MPRLCSQLQDICPARAPDVVVNTTFQWANVEVIEWESQAHTKTWDLVIEVIHLHRQV